jgi:hypothetical protein
MAMEVLARPIVTHQLVRTRYCFFHLYLKRVFRIKPAAAGSFLSFCSHLFCSHQAETYLIIQAQLKSFVLFTSNPPQQDHSCPAAIICCFRIKPAV